MTANDDPHLKRLIECINDSDFVCAAEELPLVENWAYDAEITNLENALQFINLVAKNKPKSQAFDSLRVYVANTTSIEAIIAKFELRTQDILTYGLLTLDLLSSSPDKSEISVYSCLVGQAYEEMGNYPKAKEFVSRAIEMRGDGDATYKALLLSNMMSLLARTCEYEQANACANEILTLIAENPMEFHNVASCLNNVSSLYEQIGLYNQAEQYLQQALDSIKLHWGEKNSSYAMYLSNMAVIYHDQGKNELAKQSYLRALELYTELKIEDRCIILYQNIGALYNELDDRSEAIRYFLKALECSKRIRGEYYPEQATILNNLGDVYGIMDDNAKAEQCFLQAVDIYQHVWGEKKYHDYVPLVYNLGFFYIKTKRYSEAAELFVSGKEIKKRQYIQSVDYMSEKERLVQWNSFHMHNTFEKVIPLITYLNNDNTSIIKEAYDNELFLKGVFLRSANMIRYSIFGSNDTTLIRQWNEFVELKRQIQELEKVNPLSIYLEKLKEEAEKKEKYITQISATYRQNQQQWQITWDSVRTHLARKQVAIEYMVAPLNEDSTMYCALLLRKNSKYPKMIPLFEEKELLALVNTSTEGKTNGTYSVDGNGEALQQLVWSKVLPYIKQGETIYFAPSGALHQVAIEALPFDETHTMGDTYHLVRLSSTREIVLNRSNDTHTTASLYGGIHYDVDSTTIASESRKYEDVAVSRGIENDTLDRGSVKYLPGTKREVESIDKMLKDNHLSVQLFTMTSANEESFKAISGTHQNILHIATHGFYWSDSTAQKKDYFSQRVLRMDDNLPSAHTIDPLNRCGLLFAGANIALSGHSADLPEGVQDGILTAKEISLLDLRDADLVVLSACETGKGEITGEGVFGLQRAFKQAGAQTIIMSLWPVNDAATQMLMTEFYRNWITNRQPKREAFRNAQNTVRTQFEEPVYWAGFIMLD